jgi:flagellar hook protein FlgE
MSDGIYTAETGLAAFEAGLQAISNDTANLNTPGYKGSSLLFSDLVDSNANHGAGGSGEGVATSGTTMNFTPGQLQSTGNPLDLAISGNGFFTLQDKSGNIHYSQDGQFHFGTDGKLVSTSTGEDVMAMDGNGALVPIDISSLQNNAAKATTTVSFGGNLSSTATTDTVGNVQVIDASGTAHTLSLGLVPVSGTPGSWTATLSDGSTTVGSGTIAFSSTGQPVPGSGTLSLTFTPSGGSAIPLELDFSAATSTASGASSTLAVTSQDGFAAGTLNGQSFDGSGTLVLTYTNGQTVKDGQLALANFLSPDDVRSTGSNEFSATAGHTLQTGVAGTGTFGTVESGEIEGSNVDLSQEFSNLVIMQRGYQASSQVISTASDMLSSLFNVVEH